MNSHDSQGQARSMVMTREVDLYKDSYPTVFAIKPGISGLSQISGRSDLEFEEEMRLDVLYIERWTLFLDLIIMLKAFYSLQTEKLNNYENCPDT